MGLTVPEMIQKHNLAIAMAAQVMVNVIIRHLTRVQQHLKAAISQTYDFHYQQSTALGEHGVHGKHAL